MSTAAAIIKDAANAGTTIRLDGDDLIVKGATPATLDFLRLHKPEIVEHLRVERFAARPAPLRRRPWEIDPAGERREEDGKYFRDPCSPVTRTRRATYAGSAADRPNDGVAGSLAA
jgi:hypothetical protein